MLYNYKEYRYELNVEGKEGMLTGIAAIFSLEGELEAITPPMTNPTIIALHLSAQNQITQLIEESTTAGPQVGNFIDLEGNQGVIEAFVGNGERRRALVAIGSKRIFRAEQDGKVEIRPQDRVTCFFVNPEGLRKTGKTTGEFFSFTREERVNFKINVPLWKVTA